MKQELLSGIYLQITGRQKLLGIGPDLILPKEMSHAILFTEEAIQSIITTVIPIPVIEPAAMVLVITMGMFMDGGPFLCTGQVIE